MKDIIRRYFMNQASIEEVCREALSEGLSAEQLLSKMRRWKLLLESEHAGDLTAISAEAEAAIKAMMGSGK